MTTTDAQRKAASLRAKAFYDAELRAKLEPAENGKYIVIDTESHDYEVDSSEIVAIVHLRDRRPEGYLLAFRIGYDSEERWRPRQDNSHTGKATRGANGHSGKKVTLPEISRSPASLRAEAFYDAELRAKLEPAENGKYIIIASGSHDYEVDSDLIAAAVHLLDRQPNAELFTFLVGDDNGQWVLHGLPFFVK